MSASELAQQVLAGAVRELGAAAEVEVNVDRQELALTRFANSAIHQHVTEDVTTVTVRVHTGGRTASAATTVTGAEGVEALVERAAAAVRVAPSDPGWPGLTPPTAAAGQVGYDEATAEADPRQRAAQVRAFVEAAGADGTAAGYCRTQRWQGAFVNSAGHELAARSTEAAIDGIVRHEAADGLTDGVSRLAAVRLADLDGAGLGARAAAKARAGAAAVELPPAHYQVVLEPCAVADLLSNLAAWGFNGRTYAEGQSFAQLDQAQFDASVTIDDDPYVPGAPGRPYDREGTPRQRLVLVDDGVTTAVAHNRRSAALAGGDARATGHTSPIALLPGALAANLGLRPGAAAPADRPAPTPTPAPAPAPASASTPAPVDPAAAPLLAGVERGLLVSDLWYTRVLDPKQLVMTGLTRNGVWLIENGEITAPVRNLRFTQSYPQALAPGAVRGIGPSATVLPTPWGNAWWRAPALHLADWQFTGGASG